MPKCPQCRANIGSEEGFCPECGKELVSLTVKQGWKSIPCRLKGGIIGASLLPLVLFVNKIPILGTSPIFMIPGFFIIFFPLIIPGILNLKSLASYQGCSPFGCGPTNYGYIFIVAFWILIGALIGWVIDKIKVGKEDVK